MNTGKPFKDSMQGTSISRYPCRARATSSSTPFDEIKWEGEAIVSRRLMLMESSSGMHEQVRSLGARGGAKRRQAKPPIPSRRGELRIPRGEGVQIMTLRAILEGP